MRRCTVWLAEVLAPLRWRHHAAVEATAQLARREALLLQAIREMVAANTETLAGQVRSVQTIAEATAKQAEGFSQWMQLISRQYGDPRVVTSTPQSEVAQEGQQVLDQFDAGLPLTTDAQQALMRLLDLDAE